MQFACSSISCMPAFLAVYKYTATVTDTVYKYTVTVTDTVTVTNTVTVTVTGTGTVTNTVILHTECPGYLK